MIVNISSSHSMHMIHGRLMIVHTLQDYIVEFSETSYIISESLDTIIIPVIVMIAGDTPTSSATVSFTRTDSGPAISDLDVSSVGIQRINLQISNDNTRTDEHTFIVTLVTSDDLIEIGPQSKILIDVIEDDRKLLLISISNIIIGIMPKNNII